MSEAGEKRKAKYIAFQMEDRQITEAEALEMWTNKFRLLGKSGGQNGKGHTFAHGKVSPKEAQERSAEVKRNKRGK